MKKIWHTPKVTILKVSKTMVKGGGKDGEIFEQNKNRGPIPS